MPRVIGIDSSLTATGLARIDYGGQNIWTIDTATVGAPKPTADKSKRAMARRVNALLDQIEGALDASVDLMAMEGLAYGAKGDSAWVLPWIFGRVIELAEKHDKPLIIVATSARAKYATGNGRADKDTVLAAAIKRWPEADIANNNEADATIVGVVGMHYLGHPLGEPTKFQLDVLEKVEH
ncbi:MAG: crossover junction endodeoxyribonuclease RuvC [Frankiaceae bacterium]|nr:crossover junction endodeoxyribonuclease RuvC [Frankiaceae bacterium]